MTRTLTLVLILATVAGCSRLGDGNRSGRLDVFDGHVFRGSAKAVERADRSYFASTVRPVSLSLEGAIQAAEYKGISHCLRFYGTSDIDWEVGPDTPREAFGIDDDSLTLMGRCVDEWAGDSRR